MHKMALQGYKTQMLSRVPCMTVACQMPIEGTDSSTAVRLLSHRRDNIPVIMQHSASYGVQNSAQTQCKAAQTWGVSYTPVGTTRIEEA